MNKKNIISKYIKHEVPEQIEILSYVGHQITIFSRSIYHEGDSCLANKPSYNLNELLHKILGQQYNMLLNNKNRYPDDLFVKGLFHRAEYCNKFNKYFIKCFEKSLNIQVQKNKLD